MFSPRVRSRGKREEPGSTTVPVRRVIQTTRGTTFPYLTAQAGLNPKTRRWRYVLHIIPFVQGPKEGFPGIES